MKGAFINHPASQQPDDITIDVIDRLSVTVASVFAKYGHLSVPRNYKDRMLQQGKTKTGDLDVLIIPNSAQRKQLISDRSDVVAAISNGPQLMCVIKDLLDDGKQYFIDFLQSNPTVQSSHMFYIEYGTAMPAILGVFARSLGYKFTQNGLALRLADKNGNYHNEYVATYIDDILKILMLDRAPISRGDPQLYSALGVAKWIANSPRFDSELWRKKPSVEQNVVNVNRNAKRAIKAKPEIAEAFKYLDGVSKRSAIDNANFRIERSVVGSAAVDKALKALDAQVKTKVTLVSGKDLIAIGFEPGVQLGQAIAQINRHFNVDALTDDQLNTPHLKQAAIEYAKQLLTQL